MSSKNVEVKNITLGEAVNLIEANEFEILESSLETSTSFKSKSFWEMENTHWKKTKCIIILLTLNRENLFFWIMLTENSTELSQPKIHKQYLSCHLD